MLPPRALAASIVLHVGLAVLLARGHASHATREGDAAPETHEGVDEAPAPVPLAGDTLEVPIEAREDDAPPADLGDLPDTKADETAEGEVEARRTTRHSPARVAGHGAKGDATKVTAPGASAAVFGAVGERGAVDLASAFTRGFPQAASADATWAHAPFGDAGSAVVTVTVDDSGHLVDAVVGAGASPALRRGVERTVALLRGRLLTAGGRTTQIRVHAEVSRDAVHDGLHGDVFAIGGSYTGGEGTAFFALAIGRRVDLTVRAAAR